jgi:LSD1 subclass zinc finger protein
VGVRVRMRVRISHQQSRSSDSSDCRAHVSFQTYAKSIRATICQAVKARARVVGPRLRVGTGLYGVNSKAIRVGVRVRVRARKTTRVTICEAS